MDIELKDVEYDQTKIKLAEDQTVVFNRPKHFIGSNGSVWASEFMRLHHLEPNLFLVNKTEKSHDIGLNIQLIDKLKLYSISTMKTDILNVTEKQDCKFRLYEIQRLLSLKQTVGNCLQSISSQVMKEKLGILLHDIENLQLSLQSHCFRTILCNQISKIAKKGDDLSKEIVDNCVPTLKSRVHEFTDAGPGVGVSNHDVRLRIAEVIIITNLDYCIRHHLATDDSSHNGVERMQSYARDAICDGGSIDWEYNEQYEGISENDLLKMSCAELESYELERMKFNAFKVCDDLTLRIDGAPAPNGFMKSSTSERKDMLFFNNHDYLKKFLSSSEKNKMAVPDCNYFKSIETFFNCIWKMVKSIQSLQDT
eukprot:gene4304-4873_t